MKLLLATLLALVLTGTTAAQDTGSIESIVVTVADAPVDLDNYAASVGGPRGQAESIVHSIRFTSKAPNDLMAVQVGFLSFDMMGQMTENHVETFVRTGRPTAQEVMGYVMDPSHRAGFTTGIAYLRAVRFTDGRVWKADLSPVVARARQIDSNVTPDWVRRF